MTDPNNIYKNSPDEFAEFIDSGNRTVSLGKLRGANNPFLKHGIYKRAKTFGCDFVFVECPHCSNSIGVDYDKLSTEEVKHLIKCDKCGAYFSANEREYAQYKIDQTTLAEFLSKGIGCPACRQYKKTGYLFGKLRDYDVYYASKPTEGMYKALEAEPRSILIIGQNNPSSLPSALAPRVIYLSRLLFVQNGELKFANETIEEKIPLSRRKAKVAHQVADPEPKKKSRPPIQIYTPYYLAMVKAWISQLRANHGKYERPPMKWMQAWMYENGPFEGKRLCERQMYRHIEAMTAETSNDKIDKRNPIFTMFYNGCESMSFVENFFEKDLVAEIQKTMQRATKIPGFRLRPMRTCDAAEIARTA